ncbi:hypothetical protein CO154_00925 [Candidatus Pacearchaeota archaeon CG_4_9_14_3_um_filter_31_7]|nr:MAG: hypothetical protein AUJ10_02595 [Candidatus Pacearchaeota archaeon CG1_02_31_27]PIN92462.1 MAG: hypothetical protein COU55_01510 [Candidatus Pacearchaeota archaeon CG10_big_fil_rev_8_21_14_0_10_31_59]PIZ81047.1 MAG: hypothetical protein COX99_01210 [Candidatus Pacearchaeota archaeon CG_4_10_14_0_2_um_filter_31_10]PJA70814.1 MAG: hypothetical protein CO154_00925 [Candidatus Pacearchaeota archaeon CG_4_9_14_3_um_filter_31_7]
MITEQIKKFVEEECNKPTSKYGYRAFIYHVLPVRNYALTLGKKLIEEGKKVDMEIVELAAWLHDIGSVMHRRKDHHITGARITGEKLAELNYPAEKIKKVQHCIFSHRGSQKIKRETIEAQIIADADSMSHFDDIPGLFISTFIYEKLSEGESRKSVVNKLENSWKKISPKARKIVKQKYEAAMLLLK